MIFNVLIVALAVFAYIVVGRLVLEAICRYNMCMSLDEEAVAILWPLSIPFLVVWYTAERVVFAILKRLGWDE